MTLPLKASLLAAVAVLTAAPTIGAHAATPMLPPELRADIEKGQGYGRGLELFGEPALWPQEAAAGYKTRIRLFLFPPRARRIAIRIDEDSQGRVTGHVTRRDYDPDAREWVRETAWFKVKPADFASLQALIAKSTVWEVYPEFWPFYDVCLDGVGIVMERRTIEGYRYSEGNVQCSIPSSMRAIAEQVVTLAGPDNAYALDWLR